MTIGTKVETMYGGKTVYGTITGKHGDTDYYAVETDTKEIIYRYGADLKVAAPARHNIQKVVEIRAGRKWEQTHAITDETEIYKSLATDLINKKIHAAAYIRNIKRTPNYDGTQRITVTYDNDCRAIYTVVNR